MTMKLSEGHQAVLDELYPKGFEVSPGDERYFHILFVDIVDSGEGKIGRRVGMVRKYFTKEWKGMERTIADNGIRITQHNEYSVLHDPSKVKPEPKAARSKAPKSDSI